MHPDYYIVCRDCCIYQTNPIESAMLDFVREHSGHNVSLVHTKPQLPFSTKRPLDARITALLAEISVSSRDLLSQIQLLLPSIKTATAMGAAASISDRFIAKGVGGKFGTLAEALYDKLYLLVVKGKITEEDVEKYSQDLLTTIQQELSNIKTEIREMIHEAIGEEATTASSYLEGLADSLSKARLVMGALGEYEETLEVVTGVSQEVLNNKIKEGASVYEVVGLKDGDDE